MEMERRKRRSPIDEYVDALMDSPEKLQRCTLFYQNLRSFYRKKWNCPLKAPHIQGVEVNLFRLYDTVVSFGGWQKVSSSEKWGDVAQAVGVADGVAVAEHAVKVLYMRYLSKYEQNELVGDVDEVDSEILTTRSRGKGFSSLATADCPVSMGPGSGTEFFRMRSSNNKKRDVEYDRLIKSLLCGLPNEVDFALNVCTLLSHPGPRVLRLAAAPQIITLLVAHVGVFADGDQTLPMLHEAWQADTKRDFKAFWQGAGIEDEEVLALLPGVSSPKISEVDFSLFTGLTAEFHPRDVVSWRVQQILCIMRNLSFEIINKPVMANSWPLLKLLFVCSNCQWSALRTTALDTLSNIAYEIDLTCEESSITNHLLLKTVSRCLHSDDKIQIIRALEILSGLCNNEHNEALLCEFLDNRILGKVFDVIQVKDIMICVYTLEALYQISEMGATACQQIATFPHAVSTLVALITIEAVSFGPSGLVGMKVVEFHGPPQLAPPPPQSMPPSLHVTHTPRPGGFAAPAPPGSYTPTRYTSTYRIVPTATQSSVPALGDSKVEKLTAKWIKLNCVVEMGSTIPRGELYATYVEDLRNHYSALSGSVQMFTNTIKAIFPMSVIRVGPNSSSMIIENIRLCKNHGVTSSSPAITLSLTQRIHNSVGSPHINGQAFGNDKHPTAIVRPGTSEPHSDEVSSCGTSISPRPLPNKSQVKSIVNRRLNGVMDDKNINGCSPSNTENKLCDGQGTVVNGVVIANGGYNIVSTSAPTENDGAVTMNGTTHYSLPSDHTDSLATVVSESEDCDTRCSPSSSCHCSSVCLKRRKPSTVRNFHRQEQAIASTSAAPVVEYLCEWNGCGRPFSSASSVLYHCTKEHIGHEQAIQCHWPKCDATVRAHWSMVTHLQDHHCNDPALQSAAKRRREGFGTPLGPVNPERPIEVQQHPGYSKNAAIEAIRRHAFNYLPRDITDDPEGPVTKSIRLTSCLILRNLARYSPDGRRVLRRYERMLCWLSLSRLESSSALAQLLAEIVPHSPS